jgi:hypothetical protein
VNGFYQSEKVTRCPAVIVDLFIRWILEFIKAVLNLELGEIAEQPHNKDADGILNLNKLTRLSLKKIRFIKLERTTST